MGNENIEQDEAPREIKHTWSNTNFFDVDHPFNRFMVKLGTLIAANLLFILCCLPVVTAGASLAALNSTMYELHKVDNINVAKKFFSAFKECLLEGIVGLILGLGFLSMGCFGLFYTLHASSLILMFIGFVFFGTITFVSLCFVTFYFGLIARYKNDLLRQLINGVIVGVTYVRWGFLIWLLWVLCVGVFVLVPALLSYIGFIWLLFGFSVLVYITTMIYSRIFMLVGERETTDEY